MAGTGRKDTADAARNWMLKWNEYEPLFVFRRACRELAQLLLAMMPV
jgi:hypothetical protein